MTHPTAISWRTSAAKRFGLAPLLLLACALAWAPQGPAQAQSLDDLERRLQQAREEQARRDAEAARAAAQRRAQEGRMATLAVQTDAPCTLSVNGREAAKLSRGISEVRVNPGQLLVACTSTEESASFEGEVEARSGQSTVLRITLADRVAQARQRTRCAGVRASTLLPLDNGEELLQCGSGLVWTRADNGGDVNWAQAQAHCRGLRGDWSLPTVAQLQSLSDAALPGVRCGQWTCKVSDQFRLSSGAFWSAESNGSSEAWNVNLYYGDPYSIHVGYSRTNLNFRALCVRRP